MIGSDLPVVCHRIVLLISNNKINKQDFLTGCVSFSMKSRHVASEQSGMTEAEFERKMEEAGYRLPR